MTRIGIVGANCGVGTELCALLDDAGHEPVAIVRNRLGSAFFEHANFEYRIGDVTDDADARRVLADLGAVVVAAWPGGATNPRRTRRINEGLVGNSVAYAGDGATMIYLSSVEAYGNRLYRTKLLNNLGMGSYSRENRHAERYLRDVAESKGSPWYALRMGHVMGPAELRTRNFLRWGSESDELAFAVEPDRPSNVLHAVTLADTVETLLGSTVESGVYPLVDRPQWTWREVFEWYVGGDADISFHPADDRTDVVDTILESLSGDWLGDVADVIGAGPWWHYLPEWLHERGLAHYQQRQAATEIDALRGSRGDRIDLRIFYQHPVPEPSIPGLSETRDIIDRERAIEAAFERAGQGTSSAAGTRATSRS